MFLSDNGSDIRAMEHPTLKVPYEILNKKYRASQKTIDREVSYLNSRLDEIQRNNFVLSNTQALRNTNSSCINVGQLNGSSVIIGNTNCSNDSISMDTQDSNSEDLKVVAKIDGSATPTTKAMTQLLDGVVEKLVVLKRKADESILDEQEAAQVCKRRLDHLKEGIATVTQQQQHLSTSQSTPNQNSVALNCWKKKRLDRMLVDYFLRNGYYESAVKLAKHSDIEDLTNIELFLVAREVENSLRSKETQKCLAWCHDNRSKLRKIRSGLEFKLRQQEFIELVRQDLRVAAIKYARKFLGCSIDDDKHIAELQHVMGLLAFPSDTRLEPYRTLFDESRWQLLVDTFREDNFNLFQLSPVPVFSVVLHAGLSVLKTPHCYRKSSERNSECPICSDPLNKLAKDLPYPHCSQSKLICAITGEPLNEHNIPLVLPNGQVYGKKGLTALAEQNNGIITCPRTQEQFKLHQAEKVYVM